MTRTTYYVNLNYVCNERCVFCAADLGESRRAAGRQARVTLEGVKGWMGAPPRAGDQVLLAGGEPTLHPELEQIVRLLGTQCHDVTLFTNGLRLRDEAFARSTIEAGVTRFEIALFGANAADHESITRVPRSFERTLAALTILTSLGDCGDFVVNVRLLVSRQTNARNPTIVRTVAERVPGVDSFSLNRLVLSADAEASAASVSWSDAREAINESATLVRELGYGLGYEAVPYCVYEGENARFVHEQVVERRSRINAGLEPAAGRFLYLDPHTFDNSSASGGTRVAITDACLTCDYLDVCGRVESWYVRRYGAAGISSVRPTA